MIRYSLAAVVLLFVGAYLLVAMLAIVAVLAIGFLIVYGIGFAAVSIYRALRHDA